MGLKNVFQKAAQAAIKAAGDVVEDVILISRDQNPEYNTAAPEKSVPEKYETRGVIVDYNARDIDGTIIQIGDFRILIAAVDVDIDPRLIDSVCRPNGITYKVVQPIKIDPAGALFDIHCKGVD